MKTMLIAMLATLGFGVAQASTDFTFAPAADGSYTCYTYCVGFDSSDPNHTVEAASAFGGRYMVEVDGVTYTSYTNGGVFNEVDLVNGIAVTGPRTLIATIQYTTKRTCVRSGRVPHCTTYQYAYAGSVSLP